MLLLCALVVGSTSLWATDVTYTVSTTSSVTKTGTAPTGSTATYSSTYSTAKQLTGGNSMTLTLSGYKGNKITGITLSMRSNSSKGAGTLSAVAGTTTIASISDSKFNTSSWHGSWSTSYVDVNVTMSNDSYEIQEGEDVVITISATENSLYCESFKLTYSAVDNSQVSRPTISGTTPFLSSTEVSISCNTTGAAIQYSTDDGNSWNDYSVPFTLTETTTVKAKATKSGMSDSEVASKDFTKINTLNGIAALNAAENGTYYVSLTNAQITYVNGKNGFLNDANAGIYCYNISPVLRRTYNGIYQITRSTYSNMIQVTNIVEIDGESHTTTGDEVQAPTVMTADELDANFSANLARHIQINDYVVTNSSKLTDNISFNNTYSSTNFSVGSTYKLVGYPYMSSTYKQFRVVSALIKPATPTFDPVEGEFSAAFALHLACATSGTTMYYTTDGTTPTTESTVYDSTNGIAIPAATTTVKVIAVKDGMVSDVASATYTYNSIAKPLFTPADGSQLYYGETVAITCATDGTTIYYTTDGTEPTDESNEYSAPIAITANTVTLKAFAKKGTESSSIATATFTLKAPAAPTFSIAAGAVARNTVVTITSAANTNIMYTTDGSDADNGTDAGTNSVNVTITDGMTIKAIAYDPEVNISAEASATYTIAQVEAPTFSVPSGTVVSGSTVALATTTTGATIYYTTDGTTPDENSTAYTAPIVINADVTIKAIAIKENFVNSSVVTADYEIVQPIKGFNVDFETDDLSRYVEWEFTNVGIRSGISGVSAHGGTKWGGNVNGDGNGVQNCSIQTKNKVAYPSQIKFYISKESGNTTQSSWKVYVSSDGSDWTKVGEDIDAKAMGKGAWTEVTRDLTSYNNVYVRISYGSSNAIRAIDDIELTVNDKATVTDAKYATFCSTHDLDFSATGIKVYKAASDGTKVNLTEIEDGIVPANTGVVLFSETAQSNVAIPVTTADATADFSDNELIGINAKTKVAAAGAGGKTNYILSNETAGVGFYKASATGANLGAHKAYLSTANVSAARDFLGFDEEVTGVNEMKAQKETVEGIFDLQGRKVAQPTKGLYIVNGKKVVIK